MQIYIVTLSDKKFDEKYRNFAYRSVGSMKKNLRGDIEEHLNEMDDYFTEEDEKEIEQTINRLTNSSNVGECFKLKGLGIELTCRKEDLK